MFFYVCFSSEGAGDLYIQASCRSLVSGIYEVEDCEYYKTTTYSSDTTVNIPITSSTSCKVEFDLYKSSNNSGAMAKLGDDTSNCWGIGLIGSAYYGFILDHNGSRVTTEYSSGLGNGTFHVEFTYQNGTGTCKINNVTKTYTYTQPLTKFLLYNVWNSGTISNMKIKPL